MSEQNNPEQIGGGGPSFNAESDLGEAGSGDTKVFSGFLDERANLGETVPEDLDVNATAEVRDIIIRDGAETPPLVTKTHESQDGSGRKSEDENQCSTSGQPSGNTSPEDRLFNLRATASENEGATAEKELNDGGEIEKLEAVDENPRAKAARRADSPQPISLIQPNIALPKQLALDPELYNRDVPSTSKGFGQTQGPITRNADLPVLQAQREEHDETLEKVPALPTVVQPEPNSDNLSNSYNAGDLHAEHSLHRQHSTKAKNAIVREQGSQVTNGLDESQETRDHPRSDTKIPENYGNTSNEEAISRLDGTGEENITQDVNQNSNQASFQLPASEQRHEENRLEQPSTSEASTPDTEPTENGQNENKAHFVIPGNQVNGYLFQQNANQQAELDNEPTSLTEASVLGETDEEEDADESGESDDQSSEAETEIKRNLYAREAVAVQIAEHSLVPLDPTRQVTKLTTTVEPEPNNNNVSTPQDIGNVLLEPCLQQHHQSANDREAIARAEFRSLTSSLDVFPVLPSDSDETETEEEDDNDDCSRQPVLPGFHSQDEDSEDERDPYGPSVEDPRILARRLHEEHPDIVEIQRGLQRLQCMISMWSVACHFDNVANRTTILPASGDVYQRFLSAPPEQFVYQNSPQDVAEHLYSRRRRTTVLPMAPAMYRRLLQDFREGQLVLPAQRTSNRIARNAEKRDAIPPDGCNVNHFPNPSNESPGLTVEGNNNIRDTGSQVFYAFGQWLTMLPPEADVLPLAPIIAVPVTAQEHCVQCGEDVGNGHNCLENQINTRAFVGNAGQEIPEDVRAFNDDPNM